MDDNPALTAPTPAGNPTPDKAPLGPQGPHAAPIVLGLAAMAFAGLIIAKETLNWRVDWSRVGPGTIVGIGTVMVVIGVIGLVRHQASRIHDASTPPNIGARRSTSNEN